VLRRVERNGIAACAVMAVLAWAIARGDVAAPAGVVGGGALVWISYRGIKGGVDVLVGLRPGQDDRDHGRGVGGVRGRISVAIGLVKFFTRYAILALAAYVIMARLRMPPLAVFAGASSLVIAVALEALRGSQWKS
jgi:hypothetical protein